MPTAWASRRVWKQHVCVGCGATFRYVMERTERSRSRPQESLQQAQTDAEKRVTRTLVASNDPHPCPSCGIFQGEMVTEMRFARRGCAFTAWLFLALVAAPFCGSLHPAVTPSLAIGASALLLWFHLRVALVRPNADLARNRELARAELEQKKVELVAPGRSTEPAVVPGKLPPRWPRWLFVAAIAPLLAATPFMHRALGGEASDVLWLGIPLGGALAIAATFALVYSSDEPPELVSRSEIVPVAG